MPGDRRAIVADNPWLRLKDFTPARIALGRAGTSLPTAPHLEFQLAHARARNAVHHELDTSALIAALPLKHGPTILLNSQARTRAEYLQRPDKGRRLDAAARAKLEEMSRDAEAADIVFVVADGLSALAVERHAAPFLDVMLKALETEELGSSPLIVVTQARVAVGDEIGEILGARIVVVLIGERPGLSSPDSLGIYMTYQPRVGLTDEARNCISNVRAEGLSYQEAAHKLGYLIHEATKRGLSGVNLKDEAEVRVQTLGPTRGNFLVS